MEHTGTAQMMNKKIDSTSGYLDRDFLAELSSMAVDYDATQAELDLITWNIANTVNDMWSEHKTIVYEFSDERVFETKEQFYVACSFALNAATKKKRFCDSGETLRLWCEIVETYKAFPHAELFLENLSFDHLRRAKTTSRKLEKIGKIVTPVTMLAEAVNRNWTAREMQEHYIPNNAIPPYDAMRGRLQVMMDKSYYPFLKKREDVEYCITRAKEIDERIRQAIEAEGKAAQ